MATPTPIRTPQAQAQAQPQQQPLHHIKSAARKLPIKRRPSSPPPTSSPNPSSSTHTTITPIVTLANPQTFSIIVDDGDDGGNLAIVSVPPPTNDVDDYYDAESDGADSDHSPASAAAMGSPAVVGGGGTAVPFKFHRIWSEADEIRFLEGLLACHAEGLVFPRDLNLFFDRFRGTMATPYSRSQLSEKLRRLRKKFRIASSRIARGLSHAAMSPHDRSLYDLSARLWHPSFAEGSPFAPPGTDGPKRRRRLPTHLEEQQQLSNGNDNDNDNNDDHYNSHIGEPQQQNCFYQSDPVNPVPVALYVPTTHLLPRPSSLPSPLPPPPPPVAAAAALSALENGPAVVVKTEKSCSAPLLTPQQKEPSTAAISPVEESPPANGQGNAEVVAKPDEGSLKQMVVKTVLDVFDDAVKDVQLLLPSTVAPSPHGWTEQLALVDQGSRLVFRRAEFAKKWQEQRAAELEAVASRLRLVIERTIQG